MEYELLKIAAAKNKNSTTYIPTTEEAGIPKKLLDDMYKYMDDPAMTEKLNKKYDSYITAYQLKHREKVKLTETVKAEKKTRKLLAHWFNTLHEEEIIQLIENSRRFADQVFDDLRERTKSTWELQYIENLRHRVKHGQMTLRPASDSKLKRFPVHNATKNSLHGSVYTFYRLWAHCFKAYNRKTGSIDTSK